MERMPNVKVTVTMGGRNIPVDEVRDKRIGTAFAAAAKDVGVKLDAIVCPEHKTAATNVRINFDHRGAADLKYDSCCEKLGKKIASELG